MFQSKRQRLDRKLLVVSCLVLALLMVTLPPVGATPQSLSPAAPGDVIVNEIMQNPSAVSDGSGEWFELLNMTGSDIDINGWTILDNDIDSHLIDNSGPLLIPANGYLVLGNNADSATNGGVVVDYQYSDDWFLSNGADEVILQDDMGVEIDRVEYDGGPEFPDPNGASMSLVHPSLDNNVGAHWCEASTPYGDGDLGTPGAENDCLVSAAPGDLVINEIMQNPSAVSDGSGEWFEIYNIANGAIDIDGFTILDNDTDSHLINNGGPLIILAGGYLVLGINADTATNGGAPVDYQYADFILSNSADEVIIQDTAGSEIDRVEYDGGPNFPDPNGAAMALADPTLDNNVGDNWCVASTPYGDGDFGTPGDLNDCPTGDIGVCGDPATFIHEVQGPGMSSPIEGMTVNIEGIVVGDFQDTSSELGGFFVQEEDEDADMDPMTSEGVFVYDSGFGVDVSMGDTVRVRGTVQEFFNETQVANVTGVLLCPNGLVATPASITLPVTAVSDLEWTEGMAVAFTQTLVATDNYNLGRFGEVILSVNERLQIPTNVVDPGTPASDLQDLNDRSQILLDDGSTVQNPLPLPPYIGLDNTLRAGDTTSDLVGALGYAFSTYRIQPTALVDFNRVNARPANPPDVGGSLTVASFNVLNFFPTIDDGTPTCGPNNDQDCRGADSTTELISQTLKLVDAIVNLDADIVGLQELENSTGVVTLQTLVDAVNLAAGAGTYDFVDTGVIGQGDHPIKVGLIYKTAKVQPVGNFAILDSTVDPTYNSDRNRPAVAQTFEEVGMAEAPGGRVTVVVNHLKSKGCDEATGDDLDQGDGQGCWNPTRTAGALAQVNWLASDPTGAGDTDYLIIGDLNAYALEDPIQALMDSGFADLIGDYVGFAAYSYVYFGQAGRLDHAFASPSLAPQVTGTAIWHINSDEPRALDYNDFNQPALYNPDQWRSSDHDPVIVGLHLTAPEPNIVVSPLSLSSICQDPDSQLVQTMTISNTGDALLNWMIEEEPTGPMSVAPLAPTAAPDAPADAYLALVSEETGHVASYEANGAACQFDDGYGVYLCGDSAPEVLPQRDPQRAQQAQRLLASTGLLLIPESTNDRVMAFDPITGDLVDPDFIPADTTNLSTPVNAILSAGGDSILVSDQLEDAVLEYDLDGNFIGLFAPASGVNNDILDNVRGISLDDSGNLLVTVGSGANDDAVAQFDTAGAYTGNFVANGAGGLDSPFDVYGRPADWLVNGITSDAIHRYDLTGAYIANLTAIDSFPEQANGAANDNVLVANFSGSEQGVVEYTATGTQVGIYNPASLGGYRGVYELPNGNILTTTGTGVHEIDRMGNLVETKFDGVSARFIEYVGLGDGCVNPADVPWLSTDPISGTTPAGDGIAVDVTFDSTGLAVGTYTANLCITSDDPDPGPGNETELVIVPVTLTICPPTAVTLNEFAAADSSPSPAPLPVGVPWAALPALVGLALGLAAIQRRR